MFGLIIAFVFWVYFSAIVLMVGAVIASLHDHRYRTEQDATPAEEPPAPPEPDEHSAAFPPPSASPATDEADGGADADSTQSDDAEPAEDASVYPSRS